MQERRSANRLRTDINVRWETLRTQGRGLVCDLSSSGCFVLAGGEVTQGELTRLDLVLSDELLTVWGTVVYTIGEMGFAVRFLFDGRVEEDFIKAIRTLEAGALNA
jgi:PilZ domain-containing protein